MASRLFLRCEKKRLFGSSTLSASERPHRKSTEPDRDRQTKGNSPKPVASKEAPDGQQRECSGNTDIPPGKQSCAAMFPVHGRRVVPHNSIIFDSLFSIEHGRSVLRVRGRYGTCRRSKVIRIAAV